MNGDRWIAVAFVLAIVYAIFVAWAISHSAAGDEVALIPTPPVEPPHVIYPPEKYQGDTSARVVFVSPEKVDGVCRQLGLHGKGVIYLACTTSDNTIYMPNPCQWPYDGSYRQLMCHEKGHVSGWPANHPAA